MFFFQSRKSIFSSGTFISVSLVETDIRDCKFTQFLENNHILWPKSLTLVLEKPEKYAVFMALCFAKFQIMPLLSPDNQDNTSIASVSTRETDIFVYKMSTNFVRYYESRSEMRRRMALLARSTEAVSRVWR